MNRKMTAYFNKFKKPQLVIFVLVFAVLGVYIVTRSSAVTSQTNCLAAPNVCGYPDATNTGVAQYLAAGNTLKTVSSSNYPANTTWQNGELHPNAGAVIDGWDIPGKVVVTVSNVTIKNSRIRTTGYHGILIYPVNNGVPLNTVIEDTEVNGLGNNEIGIQSNGGPYTARRVNIHRVEDGFRLGDNVKIYDSYVHDQQSPLPTAGDGAHYDGMQMLGGSNVEIRHNTLVGRDNGTIFLKTENFGGPTSIDNILIEDNLLSSRADEPVQGNVFLGASGNIPTNIVIRNNRFGAVVGTGVHANEPLRNSAGSQTTACGNIWDNDGKLIPTSNIPGNTACSGTTPPPSPPTPPAKVGDLDGDTFVTGHDLSLLLSKFNTTYAPYDIDGTPPITGHDLSLLLANFGK